MEEEEEEEEEEGTEVESGRGKGNLSSFSCPERVLLLSPSLLISASSSINKISAEGETTVRQLSSDIIMICSMFIISHEK